MEGNYREEHDKDNIDQESVEVSSPEASRKDQKQRVRKTQNESIGAYNLSISKLSFFPMLSTITYHILLPAIYIIHLSPFPLNPSHDYLLDISLLM